MQIRSYDPIVMQFRAAQVEVTGPAEVVILQCPSTASSGRRLIVTSRGGSYPFLSRPCMVSACIASLFIQPFTPAFRSMLRC